MLYLAVIVYEVISQRLLWIQKFWRWTLIFWACFLYCRAFWYRGIACRSM